MFGNIATTLGIGSGLNTSQLVRDLANAVRQPREASLAQRETLNNARISALGSARSALDVFGTALTDLLGSANFIGTPASSNAAQVGVALLPGGRPAQGVAQLRVSALATSQLMTSTVQPSAASIIGAGSISITSGATSFVANIASGATLGDVAAAINAASASANAGIAARIVTDSSGARLLINGREGAAGSFSATADSGSEPALADLISGLATVRPAANAAVEIDGIAMSFASNIVDNALGGLRLTLKGTTPPEGVSISTDIPADGLKNLLGDYVKAYNDLRGALGRATAPGLDGASGGPLAGDPGVRTMMQALGRISAAPLAPAGALRTLADLGIATARDGTLSFNAARFDAAVGSNPDAVRDLINPQRSSPDRPGLAGLFASVRDGLVAADGPLNASKRKYEAAQKQFLAQRERLDAQDSAYRDQLSRSFTAMERQLTVLKATQAYVSQQIDAWNSSNRR